MPGDAKTTHPGPGIGFCQVNEGGVLYTVTPHLKVERVLNFKL